MVSGGYPGSYPKGLLIKGLDTPTENLIFHAGTISQDGRTLTNGGRVLAITAFGNNLKDAMDSAYNTVDQINWQDVYYRKDIGQDLLAMVNNTLETSAE
jgi:phosphoribosylamine--glycine ligase